MRGSAGLFQCLAAAATILLALVVPPSARAGEEAWGRIGKPGHFVIMRHTEAPGVGDPPGFRLDDCKTQRNLDERGRAQARRIAQELSRRGLRFSKVYSSAWCRCQETARLVTGEQPNVLASLNSFFNQGERGPAQINELKTALAAIPSDEVPLLVTHQVVITGLTGLNPASGEMVVIERRASGQLSVVGRLLVR